MFQTKDTIFFRSRQPKNSPMWRYVYMLSQHLENINITVNVKPANKIDAQIMNFANPFYLEKVMIYVKELWGPVEAQITSHVNRKQ